ncbi:2-dehydro-3-deoxy-D-gluconate 5-dehydrogenase KduD [Photobacterium rosenbergii]|uniref:2-dehydro-3-deoxy-D-gluconate 5-dehydrogenase KduD n=1 Tax=Photobacterium rosenbergii TaxID=294936 RepID=A0ABU3ZIP9_9GAMM|nr:2-dehydro-3-deoxy-D-gluconate 5-dehydrogenase KduD [Photobacterium rosenbergii]MDV5170013.1 2-dehydro-3-deoxy-D-gluconate 5-dehydrogenase KduD [Photobacterium rosenbergii]
MILNSFNLDDKVAIVTGCNRGLGQGIAVGLAQAGCHIVGVSSSGSVETQQKVEAVGRQFIDIRANLMKTDDIPSIVAATLEHFGKIDILVNNAGIIRRDDAINFSESDWDDVMDINLKTTFFLSQAVAKQFIAQGHGGKIINVASMLSFQGGIRVPSYTASKSGVMGVTRLMANEWAKYNINVNAIAPGYMATENTAQLRNDNKRNQQILDRIPAERWGNPEDLAGPAVFLASDAASYIQGYTLAVDGGWLAR